ncbi:MAG: hypothetical protein LBP58_07935 [Azoarcus sp.]|jgi:Ca2+-binding RTX toxin-like protein|nr:hypothetical protein [Azoarcus sp.]
MSEDIPVAIALAGGGLAVGAAGIGAAGATIGATVGGLTAGATIGTAKSLLQMLNPFHIVSTIFKLPALIKGSFDSVVETANELPYQAPDDASESVVSTVTGTIGTFATEIAPGYIGNTIASVTTEIGNTVVAISEAFSVPTSIPESIKNASVAVTDAIGNSAKAIFPGLFGDNSILGGTISFLSSAVGGVIRGATNLLTVAVGDDPKVTHGDNGFDIIIGRGGADVLYGEGGKDLIYGEAGSDLLYGGKGNDKLYGGGDSDTLFGEDGDDVLYGGLGNDGLDGGVGNDLLYGEEGDDLLFGDAGSDKLYGGAGSDQLDGGAGNDLLSGGDGNDIYVASLGAGRDTIHEEANGGKDMVVFVGVSKSDLRLTVKDSDLVIEYSRGDSIVIDDFFAQSGSHRIEEFRFQDNADGDNIEVLGAEDLLLELL